MTRAVKSVLRPRLPARRLPSPSFILQMVPTIHTGRLRGTTRSRMEHGVLVACFVVAILTCSLATGQKPQEGLPPLTPTDNGRSIKASALEPGDFILSTTKKSLLSASIRQATGSSVSHAILHVGKDPILDEHYVIEAIGEGVVKRSLKAALEHATLAVAFRHPRMTPAKRKKVVAFAELKLGQKYDYWGVINQLACRSNGKRCKLEREANDRWYCSELILAAYKEAGAPLTATESTWQAPQDLIQLRLIDDLDYVGHLKLKYLTK